MTRQLLSWVTGRATCFRRLRIRYIGCAAMKRSRSIPERFPVKEGMMWERRNCPGWQRKIRNGMILSCRFLYEVFSPARYGNSKVYAGYTLPGNFLCPGADTIALTSGRAEKEGGQESASECVSVRSGRRQACRKIGISAIMTKLCPLDACYASAQWAFALHRR